MSRLVESSGMSLQEKRISEIGKGMRDREGEGLDKLGRGQWQTLENYSNDVLSL